MIIDANKQAPFFDTALLRRCLVYGQIYIYPTIVSCLGIEYYYNGLGISLLEYGGALPFDQAKDLSDKIIRSNYFERYYTK